MESSAMKPRLWQWYAYASSGDVFQVVGHDASSGKIQLKYFNGELTSVHETVWSSLSLELRDPPEDWGDSAYNAADMNRDGPKQAGQSQERMRHLPESPARRQPRVHADKDYEGAIWLAYRKSA